MPRVTIARSLALCALVALLFYLRFHVFVLAEVAWTYAAYPLKHHSLLDYDPRDAPSQYGHQRHDAGAPAIMHHIFLNEQCPDCPLSQRYIDNIATCRNLHKDWNFKLWTSANGTDFVDRFYPEVADAYKGYKQVIQRANILRYLLLDHYGGIYLDLDLQCRASLDPLRAHSWLTPPAHPVGINNAFILARPAHHFLRDALIPRINGHNLHWPLPYVENMLSTGCMFISAMVTRFERPDMLVLAGAHQMLRGAVTTPLFQHSGDSSWHRWDAAAFLLVGKFIWIVLPVLFVLASLSLVYSVMGWRRKYKVLKQQEEMTYMK